MNERFTPDPQRLKESKSATKRIALFIFMAASALFMLVVIAIQNSVDAPRSSSAPQSVIQPSTIPQRILPPAPQNNEPVNQTQENEQEPEEINEPEQPVRRTIQPVYVPAPKRTQPKPITSRRRTDQTARMQAATATTNISGFNTKSANNQNNASNANIIQENNNSSLNSMNNSMNDATNAFVQNSEADPNGWQRKEDFLNKSLPAEYSQHTRVFPVSNLELKSGALLPCVLISGLNSDLPGNMIAQVSENIWDTASGKYLLIPKGSRLIGAYDHQISAGQKRVLVIWSRLIFPDGSSLLLDNLQGSDSKGQIGFKGAVDNHMGTMLTSAFLVSLIGAGVEAANNNDNNNNNNSNNRSVGSIFRERTATAIADVLTQLIRKNMNRQPTITIKPGYRFMIFVQHDIVFPRTWNETKGR